MNQQILGHTLDDQQQEIVLDESKYLLVVAGAGSGKTLTILGKISYLIKNKNIDPTEIIGISFTRLATQSLKEKIKKEIGKDIDVYTFHKLSIEILKEKNKCFSIASENTLENLIHQFFSITIFEYENYQNIVLKYFKQSLRTKRKVEYEKFYQQHQKEILQLEKLLATFIHLMKCNDFSISDFTTFLKRIKKTIYIFSFWKEKNFLILALNFYLQYQEYLEENKELDFDDLIKNATEHVKEYGWSRRIKYLIIDEYQDTSYIRFELVKAIIEKTGSNLMVVGDDFQSIYRFSGCQLSLFTNFCNYFSNAKIKKIETTYRNSQELIQIAGAFVMKNKFQLKKQLISQKHEKDPIKFIYYKNIKESFLKIIEELAKDSRKTILVLGRNNKDIELILDKDWQYQENNKLISKKFLNLDIKYLTIHKSKGLEADNVIILNLQDQLLGFPTQIKNERILRLVEIEYEKYPFSEERRLFYVALTRTKNKVYLLIPTKKESIFAQELKKDYQKFIKTR